jgi:hypothetical protein
MAQLAMKQSMDEINEYLAVIDEKVDDILRAQKNAVLANMIGVDLVIEEAMTVREQVGRVSDVTWSKVQGTALTIAQTQSYAIREIDDIAEKLESKKGLDEVAKTSNLARSTVQGWLAVLARCFQLLDALAILELDRVLDSDPEELEKYRRGLKLARENRRDLIARTTSRLMARMDAAAEKANTKVLLHPIDSKTVVGSTNQVATGIVLFQQSLGVANERDSVAAKRWATAAIEMRDQLIETGSDGVDAAARLGSGALVRVKAAGQNVSGRAADTARRWRERDGSDGGDS